MSEFTDGTSCTLMVSEIKNYQTTVRDCSPFGQGLIHPDVDVLTKRERMGGPRGAQSPRAAITRTAYHHSMPTDLRLYERLHRRHRVEGVRDGGRRGSCNASVARTEILIRP